MSMQPQLTFEPFDKWGMDFVGPISPPSRHKQHNIVCIDYLTKWAETKAIKEATEEKLAEFLRENIFYKFKYQRELVTDQGSQFTSNLIEYFLTHHKIKLQALLHTEVVQPQRKIWYDKNIKEKQFQERDWELLYDSRYKDIKGKLRKRWLGPYTMENYNGNGSVLIRTIDHEAIPMLVNGPSVENLREMPLQVRVH
eukprot:PITA_31073